MTKRIFINSIVVLIAMMVAATTVSAGTSLAYNFDDEYSQRYKVKFSQEMDFVMFSQSEFIDMEITETCIGRDGDKFLMTMTFDKIESSSMMMGQMKESPLGTAMLGNTVSFSVNANGEVKDIQAKGHIDAWAVHKQVIEAIAEGWYIYLPDEDVEIGAEWSDAEVDTNQTGMIIGSEETYKYEKNKEKNGVNCVLIKGRMTLVFDGSVDSEMGLLTVEGKGGAKIEFYFDAESGIVIKMKMSGENQLDMTPNNGNVIETTINQSVEREAI